MIKIPAKKQPRWRKIDKDDFHKAEDYLKAREKFCVTASARFLRIQKNRNGHIWHIQCQEGEIAALLLHCRKSLFPVFNSRSCIPGPRFLNRFLGKVQIHSLQGLKEDAELLENLMEEQGYYATERIDYDLMGLDNAAIPKITRADPADLVFRFPLPEDMEALFSLQSAYEQEEVLPKNAVFNPAASRLGLEKILSSEQIFVAELGGQVIGKINTSAESFSRIQVGGVYVRPDCRGRGIAAKMTIAFLQNLSSNGKDITLFVKKRNNAAKAVYRKIGFAVLGDYRISYF